MPTGPSRYHHHQEDDQTNQRTFFNPYHTRILRHSPPGCKEITPITLNPLATRHYSEVMAIEISLEEFDQLVQQAIQSLAPEFARYLEEVPVAVENTPSSQTCRQMRLGRHVSLLGLFHGTPLNRRSVMGLESPNHIVLYRDNLLSCCRNKQELAEQIRKTLVHELGHYLGFSEKQLREHGY